MSFGLFQKPQVLDTVVAMEGRAALDLLEGLAAPTVIREKRPIPVVWTCGDWVSMGCGVEYCTSTVAVTEDGKCLKPKTPKFEARHLNLIRGEICTPTAKLVLKEVDGNVFSFRVRREGADFILEVPRRFDRKRTAEYVGQIRRFAMGASFGGRIVDS